MLARVLSLGALFLFFALPLRGQTQPNQIRLTFVKHEVTAYRSCSTATGSPVSKRWTASTTDPNADLGALVAAAGANGDCGYAKGYVGPFKIEVPTVPVVVTQVLPYSVRFTDFLYRSKASVSVTAATELKADTHSSVYSLAECPNQRYIDHVPAINGPATELTPTACNPNHLIELEISGPPISIPSYDFQTVYSVGYGSEPAPGEGHGMAYSVSVMTRFQFEADYSVPPDPFSPSVPTDALWQVKPTGPSACTTKKNSPMELKIPVARVVGETLADGTLAMPSVLIDSGVIGPKATLRFPVYAHSITGADVAGQVKLRANALANEFPVIEVAKDAWALKQIEVPVSALRFGKRTPGQPATAADNSFELTLDLASPNTAQNWCFATDWAEVKFEALAPLVLIHGNGQGDDGRGGWFWDGWMLDDPKADRMLMSEPFTEALKGAQIPYDNSISMMSGPIQEHAQYLGERIPAIAAEFGAKHVHLVAHSKGGLDARAFLASYVPKNFGVLSLTTLSTPHHGSPGPDYQLDSVTASALDSDDTTRTTLGKNVAPNAGTPFLRVSYVEGIFNPINVPLLPTAFTVDEEEAPIVYRSVSADANLNDNLSTWGNPSISFDETEGIPGQGMMLDTAWAYVMEQVYRILGNVASTRNEVVAVTRTIRVDGMTEEITLNVPVVKETLNQTFRLNDFAVTTVSARLEPVFTEIASLKANHSTVTRSGTARLVLDEIRRIQPVK